MPDRRSPSARSAFPRAALALLAACSTTAAQDRVAIPPVAQPPIERTPPGQARVGGAERRGPPAEASSETVRKGIRWILEHQLPSGGWGQGDEGPAMPNAQRGTAEVVDTANVADTCMAALALLRAGSTPSSGPHTEPLTRAVGYVLRSIEGSDDASLWVTEVRGTRVQSKIGTYVDTFAALMLLNEVQDKMGGAAENQRVARARSKVLAKMERNQEANGTWGQAGWAPGLSQSMAARGLNRAVQDGVTVREDVLENVETYARRQVGQDGRFNTEQAAGVEIYAAAGASSTLNESTARRASQRAELERQAASGDAPARERARRALAEEANVARAAGSANAAVAGRVNDPSFVAGFGSNGGEEFLSYMLLAESLASAGGPEWTQWKTAMVRLLAGVQNGDGSWTGHHCITGRTFCTSTALLVLLTDRDSAPTRLRG